MSRLARYTHALISGYALLGANVLFSLASVPLALAYLSRPEFGLWCLVTQIGGYLVLIDVGMSGSVSRILIDYKDHPANGHYGSVVFTSGLVGLAQGALVLVVGCGVALVAGPLLRVPAELQREFVGLIVGQSVLVAVLFVTRVFSLLLTAHQRFDVSNWTQVVLTGVNYGALWAGFAWGLGVYSALAAQALVTLGTAGLSAWWCFRLRLFPAPGQWGRPTWERFREIFSFGMDVFFYSVGYQLISASQAILVTRELGLDLAAVWTVCTRVYLLLSQVILRLFDYCYPALSEMLVRGESERLARVFRSVTVLSVSLAVAAGAVLAICNQPFVAVWTHGKVGWTLGCDLLLAVLLPVTVLVRVHIGLVGVTKDFRFLRYLYLCEGVVFAALSLAALRRFGLIAMLGASLLACLMVSFPYGLARTRRFYRLASWITPLRWCQPGLYLALVLAPLAGVVGWLTHPLAAPYALAARALLFGVPAGWLLWHLGLDATLKAELLQRLPWSRTPKAPAVQTPAAKCE